MSKQPSAKTPQDAPASSLVDLLRRRGPEFTASQETIAGFILDNLTDVVYESGDSLAKRLNISSATVSRFCQELGFRNFKELKAALRADRAVSPWLTGPRFSNFVAHDAEMEWLADAFESESKALAAVYNLPRRPEWSEVVSLLATAPRLWIAGFQIQRAFAQSLALQLQYLRPGVHLVDMASGHFAEALEGPSSDCVVIIDVHRYSRHSAELAEQVKAAGKSLIVLTDVQNLWATEYTDLVLNVPIRSEAMFWMSLSGMSSLAFLLLNAVVREIGAPVLHRLDQTSQRYRDFTGYLDQPLSSRGGAKPRRSRR